MPVCGLLFEPTGLDDDTSLILRGLCILHEKPQDTIAPLRAKRSDRSERGPAHLADQVETERAPVPPGCGSLPGRSGRPGGWRGVPPEVHLRWSVWRFAANGCRRFGLRANALVQ